MLINVNDINLNYEVYGYGKPIILLHGNGETHNIFDKLIYKLEKEYTVYAVENFSTLIGFFSFTAEHAFILADSNRLYVGKDSTISCLSITKK